MVDPDLPYNELPELPPRNEKGEVLSFLTPELIAANKALGELKGICYSLPNPDILLDLVALREGQASSAIENLVTTQDELYRALAEGKLFLDRPRTTEGNPIKEVLRYRKAMYAGEEMMRRKGGISTTVCIELVREIKANTFSIRTLPGTRIGNDQGETVYTPPEGEDLLRTKLRDWENYLNGGYESYGHDPIVAMALAHYQFEAIHPFPDGNGRTGRIVNVLHLVNAGLLDRPILYLSRFINQHRDRYYRRLRGVTERGDWMPWVEFIIEATRATAQETISDIKAIKQLMEAALEDIRSALGDGVPAERIRNLMFEHAYVKISMLDQEGVAKRQSASKYLKALTKKGGGPDLLRAERRGRDIYYRNHGLLEILESGQ